MIWLVQVFYGWHINFRLRRRAIRFSVASFNVGSSIRSHFVLSFNLSRTWCFTSFFFSLDVHERDYIYHKGHCVNLRDASSWMPRFEFFKPAELVRKTGLMECSKWSVFKFLILTAVFIQQRHITNSSAAVFASSLLESVKWNVPKDPSVNMHEHKLELM